MQTDQSASRSGSSRPAVIFGVAALLIAAGGVGAWSYLSSHQSGGLNTDGMSITVNGKEVDPKSVIKNGSFQLGGGGSFTMANVPNPQNLLSQQMKDFFALPAGAERNKLLDKMIDQQEAMKKDMKITSSADGKPQVSFSTGTGTPSTQPTQKIQIRVNGNSMADSMAPEMRAQLAEFAAAMAKRRQERGLPPQQGAVMIMKKSDSKQ